MTSKTDSRRLDIAVAEAAAISRERARALIMEGKVLVNGTPATKAGALVRRDSRIDVKDDSRYVSRGGEKLERALEVFGWSVEGLRCLDVGASTGGFTDCLLQHGAASVTALDVGYGQLAWSLRTDARVRVVERSNFRHLDPAAIGAPFDFLSVDVSFISLAKLAPVLRSSLGDGGRMVALVKPQFEAGRSAVGKGGVVRDASTHALVLGAVCASFAAAGLAPIALTFSPITGPAGNIEFLLGCIGVGRDKGAVDNERRPVPGDDGQIDIAGVVAAAHETLRK